MIVELDKQHELSTQFSCSLFNNFFSLLSLYKHICIGRFTAGGVGKGAGSGFRYIRAVPMNECI